MNKFTLNLCRTTEVFLCVYNPNPINVNIKLVAKVKKTDWFVSTDLVPTPNKDILKVELFRKLTNDIKLMNQLKTDGDKLIINNHVEHLYDKNELQKISLGATYIKHNTQFQKLYGYDITHFDLVITKV